MKLIVADASPINLLIRIELIDVLGQLCEVVAIPPAVFAELTHAQTPEIVHNWISYHPSWIKVLQLKRTDYIKIRDAGKREAIALALEIAPDFLLADNRRARNIAKELHLPMLERLDFSSSPLVRIESTRPMFWIAFNRLIFASQKHLSGKRFDWPTSTNRFVIAAF